MPHYYILSISRNLTVANLSVFLEHQKFMKPEAHIQILCFETNKFLFPLNSGKTLGHLNNYKR